MNNPEKIKEALDRLGYKLADRGAYWQTNAIFRGGDNMTAIQIYKNTGVWKDYVTGTQFLPFKVLVAQTAGSENKNLEDLLQDIEQGKNNIENVKKLEMEKVVDPSVVENLLPHHDFYLKKGINEHTLKHFKSGASTGGKMYQRYVFPIINEHDEIHGLSGRDLSKRENSNRPKWKHSGKTSSWVYPLYLKDADGSFPTRESIDSKGEVVIVESVGDCVSLYDNGFKNCLVSFGLNISSKLICALTEICPQKLFISFNNDSSSEENRGLIASIKNYCKLLRYFDYEKLYICLPNKKDFGEMSADDYDAWREKIKNIDQSVLIKNIKKQATKLHKERKLSASLFKNLKVLP